MGEDICKTLSLAQDKKPKEDDIKVSLKNLRTLCQLKPSQKVFSDCPDLTLEESRYGNLIIRHQSAPENYLSVDSNRKMIFVVDSLTDSTRYYYQDQD